MKTFLLILLPVLIQLNSSAAFNFTPAAIKAVPAKDSVQLINFPALTVKQLQVFIGRKLTLKEKVQWFFTKRLIGKIDPKDEISVKSAKRNAYLGFGFALAALAFPLFVIPGLIFSNSALRYEKQNPGTLGGAKEFAKIGQILSLAYIALLIVGLLIVFIYLAILIR